ncbi:MAG TPA: DUF4212 domain-containing protein [Planctomycetota bacterium]|nr:DUF4212 domain-containing protein [Planctomycetota bacterium]
MPPPAPDPADAVRAANARYWARVVRLTLALLVVWAAAGLGCGVLLADWLNQWQLGGFPLGFWFAQQGSILVFLVSILVYALVMARFDRQHARELAQLQGAARP